MNIIEVQNLRKSYGKVEAVQGVSFVVKEGEIFGLLGPNGAGKTTILEILEGLQLPDQGVVKIFGRDLENNLQSIRERIGIVFQQTGFFTDLSLLELLRLFQSFYKTTRYLEEIVLRFDLKKLLDREFLGLSGGQRQRFILATALLHDPKVLFLDEPTTGLDPATRQNFWDIILKLKQEGLTILLTTHYMAEAEILCDRVGIIDQGKIIVSDHPTRLINSLGLISTIQFMSNKPVNLGQLEQLTGVMVARQDRYSYFLETNDPENSLRELLEWEKKYTGRIFNLGVQQATLEDAFLKLTGHTLQE